MKCRTGLVYNRAVLKGSRSVWLRLRTLVSATSMSQNATSAVTAKGADNMSRYDMLDKLREIFPNDGDILTAVVKAMSDHEFGEVFEFIMRHYA